MAFPAVAPANDVQAVSGLVDRAIAAGYTPNPALGQFGIVSAVVSNLLTDQSPSTATQSLGAGPGGALSSNRFVFSKTGLADTVATNVVTVTVPNGKVGAILRCTFIGSLGAGGAIGAGESTHGISYDFAIARTSGVAAVALIATATGSVKQTVAGGAAATTAGAVSSVTGAVGAVNTFQLTCAVTKASGSSDNHTCMIVVEVLNEFASGVTVAAT